MASYEPLPGTSDIWEPEIQDWLLLEESARKIFSRYSYQELRTPIFERTDVFVRNLGTETDVVQKEMYTFLDRGGRSLTLRPEGTAGVIRAIANKGLSQGEEARVFYFGPMFRGERPAAGRRRQFHQIGVEAVTANLPWIDAECIAMLAHFLDDLGITGSKVMLNTRGLPEERAAVSEKLQEYFRPYFSELCEDCQRRMDTNVWRMLDCKIPSCHKIALEAPEILQLLGTESRSFFEEVCNSLDNLSIEYEIAPRLVRGLDYYVHTVFELTHPGLGAQDALAGGGRYRITLPNSNKSIEGIGFAAGMERLLLARESLGKSCKETAATDTYIVSLGEEAISQAFKLAGTLRQQGIGGKIKVDFTARSMKAQMRSANREGAKAVLILGEEEIRQGKVCCRNMLDSEQKNLDSAELLNWLTEIFTE